MGPSGPPDFPVPSRADHLYFDSISPSDRRGHGIRTPIPPSMFSLRVSAPPWCKGLWFLHSKPAGFTINTLQTRLSRKFRFPTMTLSLNHRRVLFALFLILAVPALAADDLVRSQPGPLSGGAGTHPRIRVYSRIG